MSEHVLPSDMGYTTGAEDGGELLFVRTDNGDGSQQLSGAKTVRRRMLEAYGDADAIMRQLALGHPIRTTFATYQHRDFVEGFERP